MEAGFRLRQKQSRHHHRRVLNLCVDNSDQRKSASSAARFLCSDHGDLVAITLRRGPPESPVSAFWGKGLGDSMLLSSSIAITNRHSTLSAVSTCPRRLERQ